MVEATAALVFVKGVIAPFSHGFREQIAINVGELEHQMILSGLGKKVWALSHWLRSLVSISPLYYSTMMIGAARALKPLFTTTGSILQCIIWT